MAWTDRHAAMLLRPHLERMPCGRQDKKRSFCFDQRRFVPGGQVYSRPTTISKALFGCASVTDAHPKRAFGIIDAFPKSANSAHSRRAGSPSAESAHGEDRSTQF